MCRAISFVPQRIPREGRRYRDGDRNMLKTMAICPEW